MPQPDIKFKPTNPEKIKIYYLYPEDQYIKIGVVEASGAPLSSWRKIERYIKKEAAKIGGHAVIITERGRPVQSISAHGFLYRYKNLTGIIIRWKK